MVVEVQRVPSHQAFKVKVDLADPRISGEKPRGTSGKKEDPAQPDPRKKVGSTCSCPLEGFGVPCLLNAWSIPLIPRERVKLEANQGVRMGGWVSERDISGGGIGGSEVGAKITPPSPQKSLIYLFVCLFYIFI